MKQIYSTCRIAGRTFTLAEHLDSYPAAQLAAAEYRCEGLYCRVEPIFNHSIYYVWTAPGRKLMPRTLPGEVVKRGSSRLLSRTA